MDQSQEIISQTLQGARYLDLLAKTAKTRLKDTRRVLLAIEALEFAFDVSPGHETGHLLDRPSTTEAAACDRIYRAMIEQSEEQARLRKALNSIAQMKNMRGERPSEQPGFLPAEVTAVRGTA